MSGQESIGPDGLTASERKLYLSAERVVRELNDRLRVRGSRKVFRVRSEDDS